MGQGQQALSASLDKTVRLWDLNSGKVLWTFLGHDEGVLCVAVTADGKRYLMERVGPGEMVRSREMKGSSFIERPTDGPRRHA